MMAIIGRPSSAAFLPHSYMYIALAKQYIFVEHAKVLHRKPRSPFPLNKRVDGRDTYGGTQLLWHHHDLLYQFPQPGNTSSTIYKFLARSLQDLKNERRWQFLSLISTSSKFMRRLITTTRDDTSEKMRTSRKTQNCSIKTIYSRETSIWSSSYNKPRAVMGSLIFFFWLTKSAKWCPPSYVHTRTQIKS